MSGTNAIATILIGSLSSAGLQSNLTRATATRTQAFPRGRGLINLEHVGGLWVLEAANLDEARSVGAQGAVGPPVEVGPFH